MTTCCASTSSCCARSRSKRDPSPSRSRVREHGDQPLDQSDERPRRLEPLGRGRRRATRLERVAAQLPQLRVTLGLRRLPGRDAGALQCLTQAECRQRLIDLKELRKPGAFARVARCGIREHPPCRLRRRHHVGSRANRPRARPVADDGLDNLLLGALLRKRIATARRRASARAQPDNGSA